VIVLVLIGVRLEALYWHDVHTKFHENPSADLDVIGGGDKHMTVMVPKY
jgi:hypothetical protein